MCRQKRGTEPTREVLNLSARLMMSDQSFS